MSAMSANRTYLARRPRPRVIVADSDEDLVREAKAFAFHMAVRGYPSGHEDRQRRLTDELTARREDGLSNVLQHIAPGHR